MAIGVTQSKMKLNLKVRFLLLVDVYTTITAHSWFVSNYKPIHVSCAMHIGLSANVSPSHDCTFLHCFPFDETKGFFDNTFKGKVGLFNVTVI